LAAKLEVGDGIEPIFEFFRVLIVEVGEDNGDDVVEIIVGDDGDNGDMNLNTGSSYNHNYGEYPIFIVFVCDRHLASSGPLITSFLAIHRGLFMILE